MTTHAMETRRTTDAALGTTRAAEVARTPAVDICENEAELRLVANLPGVEQGGAEVVVEGDVLRIEAESKAEPPAGYELVHREFEPARFRRQFTLSNRVQTGAIRARLTNGVLDLRIPKAEEVRTRKVEITT